MAGNRLRAPCSRIGCLSSLGHLIEYKLCLLRFTGSTRLSHRLLPSDLIICLRAIAAAGAKRRQIILVEIWGAAPGKFAGRGFLQHISGDLPKQRFTCHCNGRLANARPFLTSDACALPGCSQKRSAIFQSCIHRMLQCRDLNTVPPAVTDMSLAKPGKNKFR